MAQRRARPFPWVLALGMCLVACGQSATPALCGNGTLDPGETCDPPAHPCPASCQGPSACVVGELTGSAAQCSLACSAREITACADGDGCCPAACTDLLDSDCGLNEVSFVDTFAGHEIPTSAVGELALELRLSRPAAVDLTVRILASGSATDVDSPAFGGTPVCGSYYELAPDTVTFEAGEASSTVVLRTRHRTTPDGLHIPFHRVDLALAISIDEGSQGLVRLGANSRLDIVLVDDVTAVVKNVLDYGARADGVTDDTAAFQAAQDAVQAEIDPVTEHGIVYLPKGTYLIKGPIENYPGTSWVGESRGETILRRPTKAWYEAQRGAPFEPDGYYGLYWFFHALTEDRWNAPLDSSLTVWRNLTFDGNLEAFAPVDPYTLFEQSHFLRFATATTAGMPGRLRVLLENCHFTNNITSDWTQTGNAYVQAYNNLHEGGVRGKGSAGFVGGNCSVVVRKCSMDRQLDLEQNSATGGYYGDGRIDATVDDSTIRSITVGLKAATGPQTVSISNCTLEALSTAAPACDITVTSCVLNMSTYGGLSNNMLRWAKSLLLDDCTFNIAAPESGDAGVPVYFDSHASPPVWTFRNCVFNRIGGGFPGFSAGVYEPNNHPRDRGKLVLEECTFNGAFDFAYRNNDGAELEVRDIVVNGADGVFRLHAVDSLSLPVFATIRGVVSDAPTYLHVAGTAASPTSRVDHVIEAGVRRVVLAKEHAEITAGTASSQGGYITGWDFDRGGASGRRITGTGAPPATGLKGDVYANGVDTWDCTATGYRSLSGGTHSATWVKR